MHNYSRLKPASKCRITISYVSELDLLHGNQKPIIRFVIPTTIASRYSPEPKGISSPGGTQVQYAESVPYTMEFQCHVDKLNQNISGVSSSSHPIKIDISNPENFLISFSQQGLQLFKHKIQFSCIYVFPYRAIETNLDKLNYPFCRASKALSY